MSDEHSIDHERIAEEKRIRQRAAYQRWKEKKLSDSDAHAKYIERRRQLERERYHADPEKGREKARKQRKENPKRVREAVNKSYRKHAGKRRAYAKQRRKANRAFLDCILLQCPCVVCGEADYRCLEFHHINESEKGVDVSKAVVYSRAVLLAEIAKCDVRCKNCHLKAHAHEGVVRFWKTTPRGGKTPTRPLIDSVDPHRREYLRELQKRPEWVEYNRQYQRERYQKRKARVDQMKSDRGCKRCGETDPVCLQWHHRDPKTRLGEVVSFCGLSSEKKLMAEIDKCDVLCGNCHAKEHFDERRREPWMRRCRVRQLELPFGD